MAAGDGQSLVRPTEFFDWQLAPWFGLPSHTPVQGEPGVPAHADPAAPPTDGAHTGHGCAGRPVRTVAEFSWKFQVASPVALSSVPLGATGENVFVTQTERPAFEMGSGVPKRQPTSVQSTPAGVLPAAVGPMLQSEPTQPPSVNRFVAPGGVALSGTCEMPPPRDRLPQRRFLSGMVPATSRYVLPHEPLPAVDRKSKVSWIVVVGPPIVDVVVDVDVDELDEDELVVDDDVDEEVVVGAIVVGTCVLEDDVDEDVDELDVVGIGALVEVDDVVGGDEVLDDVVVGCNDVLVVGGAPMQ